MNTTQIKGMSVWALGTLQMQIGKSIGHRAFESKGFQRRIAGMSQRSIGDAQALINGCIKRQQAASKSVVNKFWLPG